MIKCNTKVYHKVLYKVSFREYLVHQNGEKRRGKAPYITFKLDNFELGLEFVYDKEWLKELKINDKREITSYLTDITYNDSKGWISLIYGKYKCYLKRINHHEYILDFWCNAIEGMDKFNILLNEKINFAQLQK